ncbi:MAG: phage major capsid protein, partial [Phascolarctobacterium sp.]|uniref:phage major capsid protein n=1 Tax=Phascolarctobacterium sp. TaxID=2049039 RepID=UPI003A101BB9
MRLKEIEARLAEIKEELNTRAAELTDEEITKLETEVTDLQEERTALLAAAEKRKKLLERIAAGEPTGGAGADTTLLRNFKGAGGAGVGEPEDKYDTMAYRKAFMNYVCRGVAIPAEYRAAETTTTADSGAVIPTTIMNEIIQKLESYGSIYAKVRKINVQGGVSIPIADLKPTAHWITEEKSSDDQKASAKNSVTFNYYGLECKISQSILANVVTLKMFTDLFVPMATEAMVKAIEIAIFNGTGEGQPLGVLKD